VTRPVAAPRYHCVMNYANVTVFDRYDQLVVMAIVRAPKKSSKSWAVKERRDIREIQEGFLSRFTLVVAPDFVYLWKSAKPAKATPDLVVPAREILGKYMNGIDEHDFIPASTLELIVGMWLGDLAIGLARSTAPSVEKTGLTKAISGGRIDFPRAAA